MKGSVADGEIRTTGARREQIVAELVQRDFLSVQEITARFGCSVATARRDLDSLSAAGRIRRTRGGAAGLNGASRPDPAGSSMTQDPYLEEKQWIGQVAAELVADGDTIALGAGSTTMEVARRLHGRRIGVVTNYLDLARELAGVPGIILVLLGGQVDPSGHEMQGPLAEVLLAQFHLDTLFLGVNGISADTGATVISEIEAQVLRAMAARAGRVVVVADRSKIGRASLTQVFPLARISALITNVGAASPALESIKEAGVQVLIASNSVTD